MRKSALHKRFDHPASTRLPGGVPTRRTGLAALLLLALLAPAALAAPATLDLRSAAPVRLEGALAVEARGAPVVFEAPPTQPHLVVNFTGRVSVLTWETPAVLTGALDARSPPPRHENLTFHVRGATLRLVASPEGFVRSVLAPHPDARVLLAGAAPAEPGVPLVLAAPDGRVGQTDAPGSVESVPWRWDAGWTLLGTRLGKVGFPSPADPALAVEGPFRGSFEGGEATLLAPGEAARSWRLGNWQEGPLGVGNDSMGARTERWRRLVLDGEAEAFDVRPGAAWALAAPEVAWRLDGAVAWANATGAARDAEGARAFRDAPVRGEGVVRVAPGAPTAAALAWRYEAEGDWRSLHVGGAALGQPPARLDARPLAGASLLALALALLTDPGRALLGRLAGAFYTRFAPHEMLEHDMRRRIMDELAREPGVHLRELHRRVGGGWGTFDFHVGMLRQGGHLTTRREGRYIAVYRRDQTPAAPALHHPVTLRILHLLPEDGTPVDLADLRTRADVSRQLLGYHLKRLEERGLARRDDRLRQAARVPAAATPPAAMRPS